MKPTKTKTTQQTRPHTSLDFTRNSNQNNNLELFSNDFADPFNTPKQNKEINNTLGIYNNIYIFRYLTQN